MYPLYLCDINEEFIIKRLKFSKEERTRFFALGFTEGTKISIVSKIGENFIVLVRNSRYALLESDVKKIFVEPIKELKLNRKISKK